MRRFAILAAFVLASHVGTGQTAVPTPPATAAPAPAHEPVDPLGRTTPSGTVLGFLKAAAVEDYDRAAQYLNTKSKDAPDLAQKLRRVMDAGLHNGLNRLSREPDGDLSDGLAANREKVGPIEMGATKFDVELDRVKQKDGPDIWLFSPRTLRVIPDAYDSMAPPAVLEGLPAFLRDKELFQVPLWRWFLGIGVFAVAFLSASLLARLLIAFIKLFTFRSERLATWNPGTLKGPLRLILLSLACAYLSAGGRTVLARSAGYYATSALAIIGVAWLITRGSDLAYDLKQQQLIRQQALGKITVIALAKRIFQLFVWLIAILLLLQRSGVNVTALFAGLGLGGIAIALAARKTIENMFGGISLITREAMRVGDLCQVNGKTGFVEDIGLGTTRLRTLDRTVISLPNAEIAAVDLENYSMRDKFWLHQIIELRPGTTHEQMEQIVVTVSAALKKHPKIEPMSARASFIGFNPTSIKFEVFAYVLDADYNTFLVTQEKILLEILALIESSGTGIASRNDQPKQTENDLEKLAESRI